MPPSVANRNASAVRVNAGEPEAGDGNADPEHGAAHDNGDGEQRGQRAVHAVAAVEMC
jgi:hypothetical protein